MFVPFIRIIRMCPFISCHCNHYGMITFFIEQRSQGMHVGYHTLIALSKGESRQLKKVKVQRMKRTSKIFMIP